MANQLSRGRGWLELTGVQTACRKPKVTVVIPAFNEAGRVGQVIRRIPSNAVDEVIVVDDHSTDSTAKESLMAGALVISHNGPQGVGAAIKAGYMEGLSRQADILTVVAGDMQHDSAEIPKLLKAIEDDQVDYVAGTRLSNDPLGQGMPLLRYVGNVLLTFLTRLLTGIDVSDSQCGFTAISRAAIEKVDISWLSDSWGITNCLLAECRRNRLKVKFVPISTHYGARPSYIHLRTYVPCMIIILMRIFLRRITKDQEQTSLA